MKFKRGSSIFHVFMGGLWLLGSTVSEAAPVTTTINVTVTVVAPACVINNGRPIEVDFGSNVMTSRVDGRNYKKTVDYTLDCKGSTTKALKMAITGGAASGGKWLSTNKKGLAISFISNGIYFPVNTWFKFTWPNKPTLEAVPIKSDSAALTGGEFSAGATMMIDYQ